jgi:hypothetical protein
MRNLWLACACVLVGCGSGKPGSDGGGSARDMVMAPPPGAAMVSGIIGGKPVTLTAAFSGTFPTTTGQQGVLILSNRTDTCSQISAGHVEKDLQLLLFTPALEYLIGATTAPTPGTYPVITTNDGGASANMAAGEVGFIGTDANCNSTQHDLAVGGSLRLSSVAKDAFVGSFDVKLLSGAQLTGSFNASACSGLGNFGGTMSGCF